MVCELGTAKYQQILPNAKTLRRHNQKSLAGATVSNLLLSRDRRNHNHDAGSQCTESSIKNPVHLKHVPNCLLRSERQQSSEEILPERFFARALTNALSDRHADERRNNRERRPGGISELHDAVSP
jgi:hypothetical protein